MFHYLSLALLTFFIVELAFKLYAFRLEFFHHRFEVFDAIVVIVSFILDIVYISKENAFDGMGLLILLRLWRVARIINGMAHKVTGSVQKKEVFHFVSLALHCLPCETHTHTHTDRVLLLKQITFFWFVTQTSTSESQMTPSDLKT